jgi:hypothetical protein
LKNHSLIGALQALFVQVKAPVPARNGPESRTAPDIIGIFMPAPIVKAAFGFKELVVLSTRRSGPARTHVRVREPDLATGMGCTW